MAISYTNQEDSAQLYTDRADDPNHFAAGAV
jgi:hypothetical protein